jgi:hypothetical protein
VRVGSVDTLDDCVVLGELLFELLALTDVVATLEALGYIEFEASPDSVPIRDGRFVREPLLDP